MKTYFKDLFSYDHWANERLLATLRTNHIEHEHIIKIMSHLVSAQLIWLHRIQDLPVSPFPLWESYKISELESMVEESSIRWIKFLEECKITTFEEVVQYHNTKGQHFESTIKEIITHVLYHSMHHRGQVSRLMRESGIDPPLNDYIIYKRH